MLDDESWIGPARRPQSFENAMFKNRVETISYSEPVAIKFGLRRPAANAQKRSKWPFPRAAMLVTLPSGSMRLAIA